MIPPAECETSRRDDDSSRPSEFRYLARQPILDQRGAVRAYELLYRDGPGSMFCGDGDLATQTMIDNTLLFGLQNLTNGLGAFVNCTADTLIGQQIHVLPPATTVLEILETVEPSAKVIDACRHLKRAGYRLALDDFLYRSDFEPLIAIADYIKIDYLNSSVEQRRELLRHLGEFHGTLLAEKIETKAEYDEACEDGCTLFQGYFFCKPSFLKKGRVPANRCVHLELLQMLQEQPLNLPRISDVVKSEPSLAYRVLRYVNSPICGMRQKVTSIPSAVLTIGDDLMRRIGTLAVTSELNAGPSPEILRMALVRARFCEITSPLCSFDSTDQYLLGLFSLLPAMLQKPMEEAISGLPLSAPIRDALLGMPNPFRCPLQWIELHERGEFEKADAVGEPHGFARVLLCERLTQATMWADQLLCE